MKFFLCEDLSDFCSKQQLTRNSLALPLPLQLSSSCSYILLVLLFLTAVSHVIQVNTHTHTHILILYFIKCYNDEQLSLNQGCQTHFSSRGDVEENVFPSGPELVKSWCNNNLKTLTSPHCSLCFYFDCVLGTLCILLPLRERDILGQCGRQIGDIIGWVEQHGSTRAYLLHPGINSLFAEH